MESEESEKIQERKKNWFQCDFPPATTSESALFIIPFNSNQRGLIKKFHNYEKYLLVLEPFEETPPARGLNLRNAETSPLFVDAPLQILDEQSKIKAFGNRQFAYCMEGSLYKITQSASQL
ncbi:hypothetical protein RUM43_010589 [Polyplax serrata]|uniref:Uncharacterized protein n=1 Tax=Polyplax serrata TaxID=468196 RepID=A0AAN8SA06_POLSC